MTVIVQLSDPHFGTERPEVLTALQDWLTVEPPDVLVLSGDITQRARRVARAQARALAEQAGSPTGGEDASLALRAAGFAREHPLAVAAIAGVALVAGPRRLIRWAGIVLPMVMRLRR